jgi:uncharacterized protein (DUF2164 family)
MQDQSLSSTVDPTIRTVQNTADSPVPYNQNEAKKKLQAVIQNKLQMKTTVNLIQYEHLLHFFDHENGGKYYLKQGYHGNDTAVSDYISENKNKFSFISN